MALGRDRAGPRPAALSVKPLPDPFPLFLAFPGRFGRSCRGRQAGQAIVEYAIVFPIVLLIALSLIQLAHIFVAKQVVSYAAFCAARAALVGEDPDRAAAFVCSPITGTTGADRPEEFTLPGWGELRGSGASMVKTQPAVIDLAEGRYVSAEVTHQFQLQIPIADELTYRVASVLMGVENVDRATYGAPHLNIRGTAMLAVPPEP